MPVLLSSKAALIGGNSTTTGPSYRALIKTVLSLCLSHAVRYCRRRPPNKRPAPQPTTRDHCPTAGARPPQARRVQLPVPGRSPPAAAGASKVDPPHTARNPGCFRRRPSTPVTLRPRHMRWGVFSSRARPMPSQDNVRIPALAIRTHMGMLHRGLEARLFC